MFGIIGFHCCRPIEISVMTKQKVGLAIDLIAGVGLILAALYTQSSMVGLCSMVAIGGAEISASVFFILDKLAPKIRDYCSDLLTTEEDKQKRNAMLDHLYND